jgi:hypothetical protein
MLGRRDRWCAPTLGSPAAGRARRVEDAVWSAPDATLGRAISIVAACRPRQVRTRPRRRAVPRLDGAHYVNDNTAYSLYRIVPNEGPLSLSG